jgi:hypothetical protein
MAVVTGSSAALASALSLLGFGLFARSAGLASAGCGGPAFSAAAGGSPEASSPEASAPDASGPEASPVDSSPADAPRAEADAPGTWCSTQTDHQFCDDFDTLPLPSNFTDETMSGGGTLSYDTMIFRSAPNAFLATMPVPLSGAPASPKALLSKAFLRDGSRVVMQADFRIRAECVLGPDYVVPVGLVFSDYGLGLVGSATSGALVESTPAPDGGAMESLSHPLTMPLPVDTWFTLTLDAQLGAAHTVNVTVNGTPMLSAAFNKTMLEPATAPEHPILVVGAEAYTVPGAATTGCTVHVDNVLMDIRLL